MAKMYIHISIIYLLLSRDLDEWAGGSSHVHRNVTKIVKRKRKKEKNSSQADRAPKKLQSKKQVIPTLKLRCR